MEIPSNFKFLPFVIAKLIRDNESFRLNLKAFAPNISADIDSYHSNPNCGCLPKIHVTILSNTKKYLDFTNNFLRDNPQVNLNLQEIESLHANTSKQIAGEVFIIDNSVEAFKTFHNKIKSEKCFFRAFSVVDKGDKLAIYFL
jgi:hypothetical protein